MTKTSHGVVGYQGELAALVSSFALAITPYFFIHGYSQKCSPYVLNFWKGLLSIVIFVVLLLATQQAFFPADETKTYILLILSGFLGIGLGDTLYFQAFEVLGPRWAVLLETITPSFTGLISFFYFSSTLSLLQWTGMIITGLGIYIVAHKSEEQENQLNQQQQEKLDSTIEVQQVEVYKSKLDKLDDENQVQEIQTQDYLKHQEDNSNTKLATLEIAQDNNQSGGTVIYGQKFSKEFIIGLLKGIAFAFCQAFGMVLAHDAAQSGKFTPLETTFVRVLTGQIYVTFVMLLTCDRLHWPSKNTEETMYYLGGICSCSILGIWAQQTSLKYVRPEISQTIIATSPIFSLFIGCLRRDQIHIKDIIGSIISIIGVSMVIWM